MARKVPCSLYRVLEEDNLLAEVALALSCTLDTDL